MHVWLSARLAAHSTEFLEAADQVGVGAWLPRVKPQQQPASIQKPAKTDSRSA